MKNMNENKENIGNVGLFTVKIWNIFLSITFNYTFIDKLIFFFLRKDLRFSLKFMDLVH